MFYLYACFVETGGIFVRQFLQAHLTIVGKKISLAQSFSFVEALAVDAIIAGRNVFHFLIEHLAVFLAYPCCAIRHHVANDVTWVVYKKVVKLVIFYRPVSVGTDGSVFSWNFKFPCSILRPIIVNPFAACVFVSANVFSCFLVHAFKACVFYKVRHVYIIFFLAKDYSVIGGFVNEIEFCGLRFVRLLYIETSLVGSRQVIREIERCFCFSAVFAP